MTGLIGAIAALISAWQRRARTRRALRGLSDALLDDIGVSPSHAGREAAKAPWRD